MSAADASGASAALAVESAGMALPPWLMVSVASRVVVGESALFVCNLLDVSSSGRERVSPLVRWTRQHQSLRNMSEGATFFLGHLGFGDREVPMGGAGRLEGLGGEGGGGSARVVRDATTHTQMHL
mmetsp:Transcript_17392/g.48109  ORF Transcript_17392/g.48109 Transcript_17392/m.48109 type:complete len:126 (-) Transcript_17392:47-424(-)